MAGSAWQWLAVGGSDKQWRATAGSGRAMTAKILAVRGNDWQCTAMTGSRGSQKSVNVGIVPEATG